MKNNTRLAYLLPVRSVIFFLIFAVGACVTKKELSDISGWWSVAASAVNIVNIIALVLLAKKAGGSFGELINYRKGRTKAGQTILMSFLILLVGMAGMYLAGYICYGVIPYAAPMMIAPAPAVLAAVNILILPVTTALAEDGLYLGCGVNQMKNKYAAVLVPTFFYALQHCFIPTLFDVRYIIYRFISFLPCALMLCWIYYKKRNPVPIMVGHAIIDLATAGQIAATSMIPGFYEMMCGM